MKLYLASGLQNRDTVAQIAQDLRELGHVITYDWTAHGSVQDASYEEKAAVAQAEVGGAISAEMVVAILPGGRGTHVEIGAALGAGIPVVVVYQQVEDLKIGGIDCVFYSHPGVFLLEWLAVPASHVPLVEGLPWWLDGAGVAWSVELKRRMAETITRRENEVMTFVELQLMGHTTLHGWMKWDDRDNSGFDIEVWNVSHHDYLCGWRVMHIGKSAVYSIRVMEFEDVVVWLAKQNQAPLGMEEAWGVCQTWKRDMDAQELLEAMNSGDIPF